MIELKTHKIYNKKDMARKKISPNECIKFHFKYSSKYALFTKFKSFFFRYR